MKIIFVLFTIFLIINFNLVFAQSQNQVDTGYDISKLMMNPYTISYNGVDYVIFYRITISSIEYGNVDTDAKVVEMTVVPERTSIQIKLDNIKNDDLMSIRFPHELISAEGERFLLHVNNSNVGYEMAHYGDETSITFILPAGSQNVELVGTRVIPELGMYAGLVLVAGIVGVLFTTRLKFPVYNL